MQQRGVLAAGLMLAASALRAETLVFDANELIPASAASNAVGAPCVEITDDGAAHALWVMGPMGDEGIWVASHASGAAYGAATRLDSVAPASVDYGPFRGPTMRAAGSYLVAGWKDRMSDAPEPIWCARSTDSGRTWEPALRADPGVVAPGYFRDFQTVGVFPDGRIAHAWMLTETGTGTTEYDWTAQDAGGTFTSPVVATAAMTGQPCECCYPDQIVLDDGTTVLLAFRGNVSNLRTIHVARSTDGGRTFPQDDMVDTSGWMIGACPATGPSIVADGSTVLVTWMSGASGTRIWSAKSVDGGATWSPMIRVDDFGGGRTVKYPEAALRGQLAVVTWEGTRADGGRGIFACVSTDAGSTWGPSALVSDDASSSDRWNPSVAIAPDLTIEIVWVDQRLGPPRLFRAVGRTATAAGPYVLRERLTGPLEGSLPVIGALLSDGVRQYQGLFGASLPFTDPEPVLLPSAGDTLLFYAFDDPSVPRIGVEKDVAAGSVRIVQRP